jgi:hypothetical protein
MPVPWTMHIPQAMQQHGASRSSNAKPLDDALLADRELQARQPNQAEDAASLTRPDAPPSSA